jgi:ElaB/YqjD/DUF883 family membrane-anchored ribosome-binding protein
MSTRTDRFGKEVQEVEKDLKEMGGTVRDAAREKLGEVGETASKYYAEGREPVHGIACACEQFLHKRPLTSVLIGAGVGWLLGRFWKRD